MDEAQARTNKERIQRYTQRVWVDGDLDGIEELFAPEAQVLGLPGALPPTTAGVAGLVQMLRVGLPDMACEDLSLVAEDDLVAQRFRVRGTHQGPLMGLPPSGNAVDVEGYAVSRFEAGRVVQRWGLFDVGTLRAQLTAAAGAGAQGVPA